MSAGKRLSLLIWVDICIVWFSIYSSYFFRFDGVIEGFFLYQMIVYGLISTFITLGCMFYFRLYNRVWEYASVGELVAITKAIAISTVLSFFAVSFLVGQRVPLSVFFRTAETILLLSGGTRFAWRFIRDKYMNQTKTTSRALIVGAGDCGAMIAKELRNQKKQPIEPVGFIDDDPNKQSMQILGLLVFGGRDKIAEVVSKYGIDEIIIAMPSASRNEVLEVIEICKLTKTKMKIIPSLNDVIQGKVTLNAIRDVDVEDLLGRDPVELELDGIANYVQGKIVLVTGAGGSIGSELCRQIALFKPARLLLLGHGENSIYQIDKELGESFVSIKKVALIADVQDRERIEQVFSQYKPQVVFHAAAHKHVPLMEANPAEAIKNNVFGTKNVAECADQFGAERFVLVSTDKAVNPTSIMGATKRVAELIVQNLDGTSETKFVAVRFGNVLGSRGSVVPQFKEQIARGGPVTVTHPEMVRYFMTIPEAVKLVIQAGAFARGGEIFILDMGEPVKIVRLAEDLIRLSGFEPYTEIKIAFSGIRPGEKLYEELLMSEEGLQSTAHGRIFIGKPTNLSGSDFHFLMKKLEKNSDDLSLVDLLTQIVPSFRCNNGTSKNQFLHKVD